MLEPDDRHLLDDAFKPPPDMSLDMAIGTSFTLDLQALLIAPVSFSMFGAATTSGGQDPLALLEAVRRHADRITIYSQAGCIAVPTRLKSIMAWLEGSVVPVKPPTANRLFHPKVWVMRFVNDEGEHRHRLLVASRNLTFDTSWDTIVRLEGRPADQSGNDTKSITTKTNATNEPLAAFLRYLPTNAVIPPSPERLGQLEDLAASLASVQWELPFRARKVSFWPLGIGAPHSPDLSGDRTLIVSPFLSSQTVSSLANGPGDHQIVSRLSSLDGLSGEALAQFDEKFVFDSVPPPAATDTDEVDVDTGEANTEQPTDDGVERPGVTLHGLHAKLYLVERGATTRIFTGSANATDPAFDGNVEFLVELVGLTREWGIEATMSTQGHGTSLRDLLLPFTPSDDALSDSSEADKIARNLDRLVRQVAERSFEVHVEADGDEFRLRILSADPLPILPDGTSLTMRAATVAASSRPPTAIEASKPVNVDAGSVTFDGITSFVVVTATTTHEGSTLTSSSLVNARLTGAPADRRERMVASQLANSDDLIRYLLFLLYEPSSAAQMDGLMAQLGAGGNHASHEAGVPLLETLLAALARGDAGIRRVAERIADIRSTPEGAKLIPAGFDAIWEPIEAVLKEQAE